MRTMRMYALSECVYVAVSLVLSSTGVLMSEEEEVFMSSFEKDDEGHIWRSIREKGRFVPSMDNFEATYEWAPPDGVALAGPFTSGSGIEVIDAVRVDDDDRSVTVRVFARSMRPYARSRRQRTPSETRVHVSLLVDGAEANSTSVVVSPRRLRGVAGTDSNDDGANVWIDYGDYGGESGTPYRLQASEAIWYQPIASDPIADQWYETQIDELPSPANYAPGPIQVPNGVRALFGTWGPEMINSREVPNCAERWCEECKWREPYGCKYETQLPDGCRCTEAIEIVHLTGDGPSTYELQRENAPLISNSYTPWPAVLDAHLFYDNVDDRLWMSWGGWTVFATELDPKTGKLVNASITDSEVDTHPQGTHEPILSWSPSAWLGGDPHVPDGWEGDMFSPASYMEGPALFRHPNTRRWFAFGSYGNLAFDYTIRMCASDEDTPRNFKDKEGKSCTQYDPLRRRYGASFLLNQEGNHTVPGHPSIWTEETGDHLRYFIGYDARAWACEMNDAETACRDGSAIEDVDYMAIRELAWDSSGWPTIWTPIDVSIRLPLSTSSRPGNDATVDTDDDDDTDGYSIGVGLRVESGIAGFDDVRIFMSSPSHP